MESVFNVPVETILKVEENELMIDDGPTFPQTTLTASSESINSQCEKSKVNLGALSSLNLNKCIRNRIGSSVSLCDDKNINGTTMVIKEWSSACESNGLDQSLIPSTLSQPFSCNMQEFPIEEKFLLQIDYKSKNKLKAKQRRLDYRSQERVRQRTVMRMKRQDPRFRAAEREKGRYRMQQKRLDPVFRSQERERQRERMKKKRCDPQFREREREQQKSRIHMKRLDPVFKEKERALDRLRMRIKRQNDNFFSTNNVKNQMDINLNLVNQKHITENQTDNFDINMPNTQSVFPENINATLLSVRSKGPTVDSFHFKKQHILNFNFYNSTKEQWATTHDDLYSKAIACFKITSENEKIKTSMIAGNVSTNFQQEHPEKHAQLSEISIIKPEL